MPSDLRGDLGRLISLDESSASTRGATLRDEQAGRFQLGSSPNDEETSVQHNGRPKGFRRDVDDSEMMVSDVARRARRGDFRDTHSLGPRITNHVAPQFVGCRAAEHAIPAGIFATTR